MTPFSLHSDLYNQPIRLDPAGQKVPIEILQDFFSNCPLSTIRELLWEMTEAALSLPDSTYDEADKRRHLLWFYRQLEEALEAAWLLSERKKRNG